MKYMLKMIFVVFVSVVCWVFVLLGFVDELLKLMCGVDVMVQDLVLEVKKFVGGKLGG